ncbi:MFS transporter [Roseomonas elaeocarpi]|uniref:MFS transporter n=1 Tax=Roseomonas elaeocarpi TaxID=907779 RepID=A0ABV6JUC4_9PROT
MTLAAPNPAQHRSLTRNDTRTLVLASLGGALEFYDFIIYVFFAAAIGKVFFPADMPGWLEQLNTYGIFAAGYLARPLGGVIMAHFGDKSGRKRMFTLSVFLMALPTLIIGLMPTFATIGYAAPVLLLVMRLLQGAAIGGEAPGAWVFVSEHVPANRVGLACGLLTGGLTGGILLGSLMNTAINYSYTPAEVVDWAWRIPFVVGGIFGFIAMYLRRWLHETPVFEAMRARKATAELPLKHVLNSHGGSVIVSMLVTWLLTAAIVVMILLTPGLLGRLNGIPATVTSVASICATLTLTVSAIVCGALMDRFGAVVVAVIGGIALIASSYWLYIGTAANPANMAALSALCGATVGMITVVPFVMVRAFPGVVRFTGVSFSYNVAYAIFGGLTPIAVTQMLGYDKLGPVHYVAFTAVVGVLAVIANALRGTNRVSAPLAAE